MNHKARFVPRVPLEINVVHLNEPAKTIMVIVVNSSLNAQKELN